MKYSKARLISAIFLVLFAGATSLLAAEPSRVINGHFFIPSEIMPSPFPLTHFASATGGGIAFGLKTPFVDFDGQDLGTLEGDVGFMALGFRYQQRFGNWFAARAEFGGAARAGIDEQSILAQGVSGSYQFNFGGTARIMQSERVILSGALDFDNNQLVGVDPYGFAAGVIEDGLDNDNDLVKTGNSSNSKLGLIVGWAPKAWLGVTGVLEGGRSGMNTDDPSTSLGGGATVGFDMNSLGWVPIGMQLLGKTDAFSNSGSDLADRTWIYGFSLAYTGWDDFSLSFETTMNVLERRDGGEDFEAFVATFNLRYWPD